MAYSELTPAYPAASEAWVNDWRLISFAPHTPPAIRSGGQVGPGDAVGCDGPAEDGTVEAEAENELGPPPDEVAWLGCEVITVAMPALAPATTNTLAAASTGAQPRPLVQAGPRRARGSRCPPRAPSASRAS